MCRPTVMGMTRPSNRDRFPRWKRKWWVCSHSWHEVTLGSAVWVSRVAEVKECSVGKRGVASSRVEDILQ